MIFNSETSCQCRFFTGQKFKTRTFRLHIQMRQHRNSTNFFHSICNVNTGQTEDDHQDTSTCAAIKVFKYKWLCAVLYRYNMGTGIFARMRLNLWPFVRIFILIDAMVRTYYMATPSDVANEWCRQFFCGRSGSQCETIGETGNKWPALHSSFIIIY